MDRRATKESVTRLGWNQKIVRIRKEYSDLCAFLDYFALETGRDSLRIYEEIINYSLDKIIFDGFHYKVIDRAERREPKGLLLSEETQKRFKNEYDIYSEVYYNKYHKKFTVGVFAELLIFIYCENNFEEKHKKYVTMDWGFIDLKK